MITIKRAFVLGAIMGLAACVSTVDAPQIDTTALGYIQMNADGTDPQIHNSSRDDVEGVFEEGVFFCRNALTHVQRGRGFQRGEELRRHAAEFGFGIGPAASEAVQHYAGEGTLKTFAGRDDTRVLAVLNYDSQQCVVLAFNAPDADAGHRRILDLNITSAEEMVGTQRLFPDAVNNGRWCYREASMFRLSGKELLMSGGGVGPYDVTAVARYAATAGCAPLSDSES